MNTITTYILLAAVVSAQLLCSFAADPNRCADGVCMCSSNQTTSGQCCCSNDSSKASQASGCCQTRLATNKKAPPRICNCGCKDKPQPKPAPLDNGGSEQLIRILTQANVVTMDAPAGPEHFRRAPAVNHLFLSGLSAQPLFCLWLI